jgi:hypoxanthine phosphoribosyltransferase
MENKLEVVKTREEIQTRIGQLADEIRAVAPSGELTIVGILDDAFVFLADLIRVLDIQLNCCFMKVTKHRHGGQSEMLYTSEFDPRGRDILLVAAVAATGITLDYISSQLSTRGVKSLRTCVLIDRPGDRRVNLVPNFSAFQMDGQFVCGYGLGIQNQFRQLPYLAVMSGCEEFRSEREGDRLS